MTTSNVSIPSIDIRPDHWQIVRHILRVHVPQYEVWAFGSRAKWTAKSYSDLDLAIITEKPLSLSVNAALADDFSESNLPWKVDIVDWAATSESFRKVIERDKTVVQMGSGLDTADEWSMAPLGDLCLKITDGAHSSPPSVKFGKRMASVKDLTRFGVDLKEARQISEADFELLVKQGCQPQVGDVLIAKDGNSALDTTCLVKQPLNAVLLSSVAILRPNPEKLFPEFLKQYLSSPRTIEYLKSEFISGAAIPRVILKDFKRVTLRVPPLKEQRAIAHILGTLDDKIELNRKQNETLEAMARTLFKAWFVDFEPVRAKMEGRWQRGQSLPGLPAHLYDIFPDRLVESELGEIPEGWEIQPLSQLLIIIGGGTPKTSNPEFWDGDIPWFSVVDTPKTGDVFVIETEKSITQAGLNGSSARLIPKGTTIISARGTVGNLAIAGRDMTFNQSCYGLQGANGTGDYFVYLVAQQMVGQLKTMAHGSVFSTITRQTFDAIQQPIPQSNILQEFEKSVTPWFEIILSNVEEFRTLSQLRNALLPKLISGELRIQDAENFVKQINS